MLVSKSPSLYLIMAPEYKTGDAGDAAVPETSREVLPCREKVSAVQQEGDPGHVTFTAAYGYN